MVNWDFLFELFLSKRLSLTVYFFIIKLGTKHATWEHDHCYKVASY